MTAEELIAQYFQLIKIDSPAVLLVDCNKVDIEALAGLGFPNLRQTVMIVAVDGTPDVAKLSIADLRKALSILEAA